MRAASAAVQFLVETFGAEPLASIDPEDFYDFTAVRPTVRLVEGRSRAIDWPENSFAAARVRAADRDLIMLSGVEPSLRWKEFCSNVLEVADAGRGLPSELVDTPLDAIASLGVGIPGMRERARQLGGSLDIHTGGSGTTLRAILPLREDPDRSG